MKTVLSRAAKSQVRADPYPHIVIENALDEDYYRQLAEAFPARAFFMDSEAGLHNGKYHRSGLETLARDEAAPVWKEFVANHMSEAFYGQVLDLFGDLLHDYYGQAEERLGKSFAQMSVGPRKQELMVPSLKHPYDVMLDCQPQMDYSFTARPFRGPHVDSNRELYAGLLYLRDPADDSTGGSISLFRAKDEAAAFPAPRTIRFDCETQALMERASLELVQEVPYRANTLVFFINSWRSIHGVNRRSATLLPRRAVNIIGEICRYPDQGLFDVEVHPALQRRKAEARPNPLRHLAKRLLRS